MRLSKYINFNDNPNVKASCWDPRHPPVHLYYMYGIYSFPSPTWSGPPLISCCIRRCWTSHLI